MMKTSLKFALAATAALVFFAAAPTAQAQNVASMGPCGFGTWYNMYTLDRLPYYALHPPVYYSYPVPRPYGYSPYAYLPNVMTPEYKPADPQVMFNPYVPRGGQQPAADKSASAPLIIRNPFVVAANLPSQEVNVAARERQ